MNEFTGHRTVRATFTPSNAAATHATGIKIPAGALITSLYWENEAAVTLTDASGTVVPKVATAALCATVNIKTLPAQTVAASTAVALTRIPATGELNIVEGASGTSEVTGTFSIYVDYLYVK